MTRRQRIEAAISLDVPDRTPVLGGWIAAPHHIMELAAVTEKKYWADPVSVSVRAYDALGADGLIDVFVPKHRDDFRCVDHDTYKSAQGTMSYNEAIAHIEALPEARTIEQEFDFESEYETFSAALESGQRAAGSMLWMPAQWGAGASISWYQVYGYETFFSLIGLRQDLAIKLMRIGGARGRCRSRLVARAFREGLYPGAVLLGEDICTQRGPMISPAFIEKHYMPQLQYGLEPLVEAGCKPVWHCDGDVRPLLPMLIEAGVQGFQGFQPECGVHLEDIVKLRAGNGNKLVIFGPLAVTTELPALRPSEIKRRVRESIEICRGQASLLLFTSNTINPDVPLENIFAMREAVEE